MWLGQGRDNDVTWASPHLLMPHGSLNSRFVPHHHALQSPKLVAVGGGPAHPASGFDSQPNT